MGVTPRAYVSDITYIPTHEGWLYLTVIIDLFSRKVVSWNMSPRMKTDTVCDALTMAVWQRKPKTGFIGVITKPDGKQNKIFWITLQCFITISHCMHIWTTKVRINLKETIGDY